MNPFKCGSKLLPFWISIKSSEIVFVFSSQNQVREIKSYSDKGECQLTKISISVSLPNIYLVDIHRLGLIQIDPFRKSRRNKSRKFQNLSSSFVYDGQLERR